MKEHWKYMWAGISLGYGAEVEGRDCYWFHRENIGTGGTTLIVPKDKYWGNNG